MRARLLSHGSWLSLLLLLVHAELSFALPDTCVEQGGPATCTGPEMGAYEYTYVSANWHVPHAFATEEALIAYFENAFDPAGLMCTTTVHNPPFQPTPAGYGAATVNIPNPHVVGGDNFTVTILLGVETIQRKWELRANGTGLTSQSPSCTHAYGTGNVQLVRNRPVACPAGYAANMYTSPWNSYCFRTASVPLTTRRKNMGPCRDCDLQVGNPVNVATGNKYAEELDYRGGGMFPLEYIRRYNSDAALESSSAGPPYVKRSPMWRGTYDRAVMYSDHATYPAADVYREDGRVLRFRLVSGAWKPDADVNEQLTRTTDALGNPTGWMLRTPRDELETYNVIGQLTSIQDRSGLQHLLQYDVRGRLITVTHTFGQELQFGYDADGQLNTVTAPGNQVYAYSYITGTGSTRRLAGVLYPDGRTRQYR